MAIPQNGAAVIAVNKEGKILLEKKTSSTNKWVIPGGVQELGEDFRKVAKRELLEETGIDYDEEKLIFIDIATGEGRHKKYSNGDEVYNNTVLFVALDVEGEEIDISSLEYHDDGSGIYKIEKESSGYGWFDINKLPENTDDIDLINKYIKWLNNRN